MSGGGVLLPASVVSVPPQEGSVAWAIGEALHRVGRGATAQDGVLGPRRAPPGGGRGRRGRERVGGRGVVEHERSLVQEGKHQGLCTLGVAAATAPVFSTPGRRAASPSARPAPPCGPLVSPTSELVILFYN